MLVAMGLWRGKSTSLSQLNQCSSGNSAGLQSIIYRPPFNINQPDEVSYAGDNGIVGGKSASLSGFSVPMTTSLLASSLSFTNLLST